MMKDLDEAIQHCLEVAEQKEQEAKEAHVLSGMDCLECAKEHRQLAEWLRELKRYRKQIQNLIDNKSFEIVNPFNTYECARVVRVADLVTDLYNLMEVNADDGKGTD